MWKAWDYISAGSRVTYDKLTDQTSYLVSYFYSAEDQLENSNDGIEDYKDVIEIKEFTNEGDSTRIFPEVGYYDEYSTFFSYPTYICDNIYLGSAFNAASYETLKDLNIKVVLNITKEISNHYPDDISYIRYDIYDNNKHSILKHLESAFRDIQHHQQNTEGNILIHCYMGRSRSVSVLLYYLMKTRKHNTGESYSFDDALKFVREKRPIINPTFRFTKDLAKSIMN